MWYSFGGSSMKRAKYYIINTIISFIFLIATGCEYNNHLNKAISLFYSSGTASIKQCLIKVHPDTISLISETSTKEETQTTEVATSNEIIDNPAIIWSLFDANTVSAYIATASHRFNINFGKTITLNRIKIFGSTTYTMNVYNGPADDMIKIPSLCVEKSVLKEASWNIFNVEEPVKTNSIILEIIPDGDIGISELEFWNEEQVNVGDESLNNNLENIITSESLKTAIEKSTGCVVEKTAFPNEISISGTKEEKAIAQMHVSLTNNPIVYKRAFIKYKGKNIITPVSIERRINNLSWNGGYDIPTKEGTTPSKDWIEHFEEINPAWLVSGDNIIEFRTNKADISIQKLTLVMVRDNGWNQVITASKPEAYDNDETTSVEIVDDSDKLDFEFERSIEPESVIIYLAKKTSAQASIQYLSNSQWLPMKSKWTIDLSKMNPGWNVITLPAAVKTTALRLQTVSAGQSDQESNKVAINEIRVCGSPSGDPNIQPRIILSYPRNGEFYGRTAYIQGFVNSSYQAQIGVENSTVNSQIQDNSFSLSLTKDDTRFGGQVDDETWDPVASAVWQVFFVSNIIHLTNNLLSTSSGDSGSTSGGTTGGSTSGGNNGYTTEVYPDSAKTITYGPITIEIPVGAVNEEITITIIPLAKSEVASLNPGMINVTYPAAGYRFLVNGKPHYNFKKSINVSFIYSKTLLLQGQGDNDVFMYYYDESQKTWKRLRRVNTTAGKTAIVNVAVNSTIISPVKSMVTTTGIGMITSETDHFTDIINGTITVPEHPDPLLYNPNSIKDIKVGKPGEGINLIEPPQLNVTGDTSLSYPIEVPPGRNGLQPNLAVVYNSSHDNGWMGVGWDIPIRAIAIDTKFGVPRYNGTEKYLLEGEPIELVPNGYYQTRVEGTFRKIIRHNETSNTIWWEVFDKNGTKYIYGQNDSSRLKNYRNPGGTIGANGNIFVWCLERIIDANGNTINYEYENDYKPAVNGSEPSNQIYLRRIIYTGNISGFVGPYSVVFNRDDGSRMDKIINCRGGFKTLIRHLLNNIEVKYKENNIRRYVFTYQQGQFYKSLLTSIRQYGEGESTGSDNLFNTHSFQYYNDVPKDSNGNLGLFSDSTNITNLFRNLFGMYISSETTKSIKFIDLSGHGTTTIQNNVELIDIDGDGLVDQVYSQNGIIYYRKNFGCQNNACIEIKYSNPITISSLSGKVSNLSQDTSETNFLRKVNKLVPPYTWNHDVTNSTSYSNSYFSDVNGDGLIDFIDLSTNEGVIYFNSINEFGIPSFSINNPVGFGSENDISRIPDTEIETESIEELLKKYHRDDPILMWQAPYDGVIKISGDIQLISKQLLKGGDKEYKTDDGVRVSIQKNKALLWSHEIPSGNYQSVSPEGLDTVLIKAGDRLYFRVNSIYDGAFDVVEWNPLIEYLNVDTATIDENGITVYRYEAKSDVVNYGYNNIGAVPVKGNLQFTGNIVKSGITSDDITVNIFKINENDVKTELYTFSIPGNENGEINLNLPNNIAVEKSDKILFLLSSDTPVDWSKITFNPQAVYTEIDGYSSAYDSQGHPLISFFLPVNIMYYPIPDNGPVLPYVVPDGKQGRARIIYSIDPFQDTIGMPYDYEAAITIAIKKDGKIIKKEKGTIRTAINNKILIDETIDLNVGDKLYFVSTSDKSDYRSYVQPGLPIIYHEVDNGTDEEGNINTNIGVDCIDISYKPSETEQSFGGGYRSWYFGRWNGENEYLDPDKMIIPDNNQSELNNDQIANLVKEQLDIFSPMSPAMSNVIKDDQLEGLWDGLEKECWIGPVHNPGNNNEIIFTLSSTRITKKYVSPKGNSYSGSNSRGIKKVTKATFDNSYVADGPFIYSATISGHSSTESDILDLNGDDYPDLIIKDKVNYTNPDGSLEESQTFDASYVRRNYSKNTMLNMGNIFRTLYMGNGQVERVSHLGTGHGTTIPVQEMSDINGDGLPDIIIQNDDGAIMVRYNLGYKFSGAEPLNIGSWKSIYSQSLGITSGALGAPPVWGSAGAAILEILASSTNNETTSDIIDINGDGLPDKIIKENGNMYAYINSGEGFILNEKYQINKPGVENLLIDNNKSDHTTSKISAVLWVRYFPVFFLMKKEMVLAYQPIKILISMVTVFQIY